MTNQPKNLKAKWTPERIAQLRDRYKKRGMPTGVAIIELLAKEAKMKLPE